MFHGQHTDMGIQRSHLFLFTLWIDDHPQMGVQNKVRPWHIYIIITITIIITIIIMTIIIYIIYRYYCYLYIHMCMLI